MSDEPSEAALEARIRAAQHGMQAGVKLSVHREPNATDPVHLRVGLNTAMSDHAALVDLLIAKGLITRREYLASVAAWMERERAAYEAKLEAAFGGATEIKLHGLDLGGGA